MGGGVGGVIMELGCCQGARRVEECLMDGEGDAYLTGSYGK